MILKTTSTISRPAVTKTSHKVFRATELVACTNSLVVVSRASASS
jgi:hypothetical protein